MNRATRDKFAKRTDQRHLVNGNGLWETAPAIFRALNERFGPFDIDLTADAKRALCPLWFGPGSPWAEDALSTPWSTTGGGNPRLPRGTTLTHGYSNPVYGAFAQRVIAKAREEAQKGFTSVLLLPLRITKAFKAHIVAAAWDLLLPDKRLVFFENGLPRCGYDKHGKFRANAALFDSVIVRFRGGPWPSGGPRVRVWEVPPHVSAEDLERARERYEQARREQAA